MIVLRTLCLLLLRA